MAIAVGIVPFAMHAWAALHGYFWQDDFVITYRAAGAEPFDLDYLFQAYNNEHVAPGMFLLAWLITSIAPLSYPAAVLPLLAMQAATSVLLWRLLVRCFGARWAILVPFTIFTFSPLILLPTLWWAYGVQLFPLLLAMVGALGAHVCHLRDGSTRHAVFAALWTVVGMAFYVKAALFAGLLFGITVLLAPRGERSPAGWALRRYAWLWLVHATLVAGYVALYLRLTRTEIRGGEDQALPVTELFFRLIGDTFLAGIFGGPLGGSAGGTTWATPPLAVQVLATMLAVGVLIAGLLVGGRRAGRAWLLLAGYLAIDLCLVAVTRLALLGPFLSADPRYIADAVPVAVLCAAFAFLPPRLHGQAGPSHAAPAPARGPRAVRVAGVVITAAFAVTAIISHQRLAGALPTDHARDYVSNARAALSQDPDLVLYDGGVPQDIMINWFLHDARPSRVIGLLPGPPRFDEPTDNLHVLDESGRPRPVNNLANTIAGQAGPIPNCGYPVEQSVTAIPLNAPARGRVLRLEYYTAEDGDATVNVGGRETTVTFHRGPHFLYLVANPPYVRVDVHRNDRSAAVCIVSIVTGEPVA